MARTEQEWRMMLDPIAEEKDGRVMEAGAGEELFDPKGGDIYINKFFDNEKLATLTNAQVWPLIWSARLDRAQGERLRNTIKTLRAMQAAMPDTDENFDALEAIDIAVGVLEAQEARISGWLRDCLRACSEYPNL